MRRQKFGKGFKVLLDYLRSRVEDSFASYIIAGICLQCLSGFLSNMKDFRFQALGWSLVFFSSFLLVVGFYFYIKAKNRHRAWCLLALVPIIGWIILIMLRGKASKN